MDYERSMAAQEDISQRIADLTAADPDGTAVTLILVSLGILAKKYPPHLDDEARRRILDNYPSATEELMSERSMAEDGVVMAVAAGSQMARIAVDYSPVTHMKPEMEKDLALPAAVGKSTTASMVSAFDNAVSSGMSPFGAATTMILLATVKALDSGVPGLQLIRPLLDAIDKAISDNEAPLSEEEATENATQFLCKQMGISRKTAMQYVDYAKKNSKL